MWQNAQDTYFEGRVLSADPIELIRMLYEAAAASVRQAREHLAAGQIAERARAISKSCAILNELGTSLDHKRGGEISVRLAQLYDYMTRQLIEANRLQSDAPLAEVLGLLATLSEGWDGVKDGVKAASQPPPRKESAWAPATPRKPAPQKAAPSPAPQAPSYQPYTPPVREVAKAPARGEAPWAPPQPYQAAGAYTKPAWETVKPAVSKAPAPPVSLGSLPVPLAPLEAAPRAENPRAESPRADSPRADNSRDDNSWSQPLPYEPVNPYASASWDTAKPAEPTRPADSPWSQPLPYEPVNPYASASWDTAKPAEPTRPADSHWAQPLPVEPESTYVSQAWNF